MRRDEDRTVVYNVGATDSMQWHCIEWDPPEVMANRGQVLPISSCQTIHLTLSPRLIEMVHPFHQCRFGVIIGIGVLVHTLSEVEGTDGKVW